MRIGWRRSVKRLVKRPAKNQAIGLTYSERGINASLCQLDDQGHLVTLQAQYFISDEVWHKPLYQWLKRNQALHLPCYVTIESDGYQSLVADKPDVEDDAVAQALRWSVNELFSVADDTVIDFYDVPVPVAGAQKVNVVVVPSTTVNNIVSGCHHAHLDLKRLEVSETSARFLVPVDDTPCLLIAQTSRTEVTAFIVKSGHVYLSRKLNHVENLHKLYGEELGYAINGNLGVELQRSMDYFDSQMRQAPVQKIYVNLALSDVSDFCQRLSTALFLDVEPLALEIDGLDKIPNPNLFSLSPLINTQRAEKGAE